MTPLQSLRRYWSALGLVSALVAGVCLITAWNEIGVLRTLLLLNFIVVLLHQFEECMWPGGFPAVANSVLLPSLNLDRFMHPLNRNSSMAANLTFAYGFYLLPAVFPDVIWLGLAPVLVGLIVQFVGHAVYVNMKIRSFYSPGVATTVFGHVPIGAIYVYYILANNLVSTLDWVLAIVYMSIALFLIFYIIEQRLLGDEDSPYAFDDDELNRYTVE